jgi:hypothetical protein
MKGDFSRDSFDASRHVYRVLMQQGRVQLDADWNEQAAVVLHRLETIVRDAFGPCAGPDDDCGFTIYSLGDGDNDDEGNFGIGAGRYYVDGQLVENHRPQRYAEIGGPPLQSGHPYIVYLDVWEEFVAPQQDPALIDPALDGLDTTARTRLAWRVRAHRVHQLPTRDEISEAWPHGYLSAALVGPRGRLAATVSPQGDGFDPALGTVRTGYHGAENRLYRVEIHDPGAAAGGATFKWSRDNGAVAFAIRSIADKGVTVESFGRDPEAVPAAGDWVEIVDDRDAGEAQPALGLFAVAHVDPAARTVTLKTAPNFAYDAAQHPVLRRWDQPSAPVPVIESAAGDDLWIALEDGIAIRFALRETDDADAVYRTGDYWTIPARTAEGGLLLWPQHADGRAALRDPAGIHHRYAPLAGIHLTPAGKLTIDRERHDYRRRFRPLTHRS